MSGSPSEPGLRWGEVWTRRQRPIVGLLLAIILGVVAFRWWNRPTFVPDPLPEAGARSGELYNRIDPNTASWERLAVLPGIGEKRAKTIIAYRNQVQAIHPDRPAFGSAEDLAQVKGIGPATVENLRPYLMFPALPVQNQP